MILLNKLALSSFDFHSVTMLLLFQCTFCVTAVRTTAALGFIELEVRLRVSCQGFSRRTRLAEPPGRCCCLSRRALCQTILFQ